MKRVLSSFKILFVLSCISFVRTGFLSVASPLTLPHLKILFGEGQGNLPNPIEIVKSLIPGRGCGLHCRNEDNEDQEQRRGESYGDHSHRHHAHGYDHAGSYQPQFPQHEHIQGYQYSQYPNWNENRRPQQTYGVPHENWQNAPIPQQVYNPHHHMNDHHNFMVPNNQSPPPFSNPSNTQFYRPRPGQPNIVETGYNPSTYQNYNPQLISPQQNTHNPHQPNIMEQTEFVEAANNPSWQNQPNIMEANSNQPQIVQPNLNGPHQFESSSNPWQNQGGMFESGFINNGPKIVENPTNPPQIMQSTSNQNNPTNVPLLNSFINNNLPDPAKSTKSSPSINPAKETNDFIYPDSARYVQKLTSQIEAESPLIDIRRR